jgi:His/Glu/Gln/Arg/opine family amino acid ABC transporter permease subunit
MLVGVVRRVCASQTTRAIAIQVLFLLAVIGAVATTVYQFQVNTAKLGLSHGYDFLWRPTSWNVSTSLIPQSSDSPYWWTFVVGLLNTLTLGILCVAVTTICGFALGLALISRNYLLSKIASAHVATFRNVPAILQVFFWYNVLKHLPSERHAWAIAGVAFLSNRGLVAASPSLDDVSAWSILSILAVGIALGGCAFWCARSKVRAWRLLSTVAAATGVAVIAGIAGPQIRFDWPALRGFGFVGGTRLTTEFLALFVALSFYSSAFIGEIVRGGLLAVSKGQIEAGRALGLPSWLIEWKIRIPLGLRSILPALSNQHLFTMKLTSLGAAIGYSDLFAVTSVSINQIGQTIELLAIMVALYFVTNYTLATGMRNLNKVFALRGR